MKFHVDILSDEVIPKKRGEGGRIRPPSPGDGGSMESITHK